MRKIKSVPTSELITELVRRGELIYEPHEFGEVVPGNGGRWVSAWTFPTLDESKSDRGGNE